MRVLFFYPDIGSFLPAHFQHGIGFLSAVLKKAGHETRLCYLSEAWSSKRLIEETENFAPGLIALSSTTHQFPYVTEIANILKPVFPKTPIICGGVHATLAPEEVLAQPSIDIVCVGEGERAIVELADSLEQDKDFSEIKNLWVKIKDAIKKNPLENLIEDLDQLPFADREIFDYQKILDQDDQRLSLLVGRGCPFKCTYCANQGKALLYHGKGRYLRLRSVENVLEEIGECEQRYQIKSLDFNDDIFTLNQNWLEKFCEKYPERFQYPFRINVHPGTVDPSLYHKLFQIGCEMVRIGVESGSERVRREIMGRQISQEKIQKAFQSAEKAGLKTWSFNMVGLPDETAEDALATYNFNRSLCPDHMQVSVFNPYPGTELYELCRKKSYLKQKMVNGYFVPESVLAFPSFSAQEIHHWHQRLVRLSQVFRNQKALARKFPNQQILFDLIEELWQAKKKAPIPDYYGEEYVIIYEEERRALIMHPPCQVIYQLELPAEVIFSFGIMMHPGVYQKGEPGGVIFLVKAGKTPETTEEMFSHHLDAKAKKDQRGFFDFELDLAKFSPGKIFLQLETKAVNPEKNFFNTAGFTNPIILTKTFRSS